MPDTPTGSHYSHQAQFVGWTREDVEEFFDGPRTHLELVAMLDILTTTEAILRLDFEARVAERRKDPLSRRFRKLRKSEGLKISLDEHILEAMKEEGVSSVTIGHFRGALNLRDWLAHGRYWSPNLGRAYTPADVFDISRELPDSVCDA